MSDKTSKTSQKHGLAALPIRPSPAISRKHLWKARDALQQPEGLPTDPEANDWILTFGLDIHEALEEAERLYAKTGASRVVYLEYVGTIDN